MRSGGKSARTLLLLPTLTSGNGHSPVAPRRLLPLIDRPERGGALTTRASHRDYRAEAPKRERCGPPGSYVRACVQRGIPTAKTRPPRAVQQSEQPAKERPRLEQRKKRRLSVAARRIAWNRRRFLGFRLQPPEQIAMMGKWWGVTKPRVGGVYPTRFSVVYPRVTLTFGWKSTRICRSYANQLTKWSTQLLNVVHMMWSRLACAFVSRNLVRDAKSSSNSGLTSRKTSRQNTQCARNFTEN